MMVSAEEVGSEFPVGIRLRRFFCRFLKYQVMEIVLKNIKVNERLSEETTCFSATIYIDGVRAGEASNRGYGGMTEYRGNDAQGMKLLLDAEEYCRKLPPRTYPGADDGKDLVLKLNLEGFIDDLVTEHLKKRDLESFVRKMEKAMLTGIVVGVPEKEYRVWKLKVTIAHFMADEKSGRQLRRLIEDKVVPSLKAGEMILNSNFSVDFTMSLKVGAERLIPHARTERKGKDDDGDDGDEKRTQGRRR